MPNPNKNHFFFRKGELIRDVLPKKTFEPKELLRQLKDNYEKKKFEYFPPEIKEVYRKNFRVFDRDQDSQIILEEFKDLMVSLNTNMAEVSVFESLFELLEIKSSTGKPGISFESFLIILSKDLKEKDIKDELKNSFSFFDDESNGYLSSEKLREFLMYNGFKYGEEQLDIFMKEADPKNEGRVYYFDFIEKITMKEMPKKKKTKKDN